MSCNHDCGNCSETCDSRDLHVKPNELSNIKKIVAVMSGKGGVGKSMTTSMLAIALKNKGLNVGILDADITGPSIPKIFGVKEKATGSQAGIFPVMSKAGIEIMSINLLLENDTDPVVWRGPVISGVVKQFYTDVIWSDIDVLLIDMPPGTGDVPLTIFQSLYIDSVIVVSSPQSLAQMVVSKSVKMAKMMDLNILGVVENMSYFVCPDNNKEYKVFGETHIDEICKSYDLEVLAKVPIDPTISSLSDSGELEKYNGNHFGKVVDKIMKL